MVVEQITEQMIELMNEQMNHQATQTRTLQLVKSTHDQVEEMEQEMALILSRRSCCSVS